MVAVHVYRWDLDRTYLDTQIHSVRGLIRTALETAAHKRNVPGAAALMRALTDGNPSARVYVLSGSPTQMRPVLEEKLALDGVRFDQLVLKDNLGNLRKGRLRAVRGQVGYKLPRLLQDRIGLAPHVTETLFGDDSEADALIYAAYAAAVAGELDEPELARILEAGDAYPDAVTRALRAFRRIGRADAVEDIFIRLDRGLPLRIFRHLGPKVVPVFSWFQAALVLWGRGRITVSGVEEVARACAEDARLSEVRLASLAQDAVRRRLVERDQVEQLVDVAEGLAPVRPAVRDALRHLGVPPPPEPPRSRPDWFAFLRDSRQAAV